MNIQQARSAIDGILSSLDDKALIKWARFKEEVEDDGTVIAWSGGVGYHLGSAKTTDFGVTKRDPETYHQRAISEALTYEAVCRRDRQHLKSEVSA